MKQRIPFIIFLLILVVGGLAQTNLHSSIAQNNTIQSIDIIGNTTSSREYITSTIGMKIGDKVTVPKVQMAVKKLYRLDIFTNIEVDLLETPDGVKLVLNVTEAQKIDKIEFHGNKKLKEKELEESIFISSGQMLCDKEIFQAQQNIKRKYIEKGFNSVKVDYSIDKKKFSELKENKKKNRNSSPEHNGGFGSDGQGKPGGSGGPPKDSNGNNKPPEHDHDFKGEPVDSSKMFNVLVFEIDEGKKAHVEDINFFGNITFSDSKLRRQMKEIHQKRFILRSGKFQEELFETDKFLIQKYYKDNGYPLVQIVSDSFYYKEDNPAEIVIDITIDEGDKYHFGGTDILGNTIFTNDKLSENISYKPGDVYSESELEKSTFFLMEPYHEDGYIFAQTEPKKTFSNDTINIHYEIFEGNRAFVRRVEIEGNSRTFDKVIRREIALKPGEVFKKSKLMRSQRNIYYLNYFNDVVPDFDVRDDGQVDVTFQVEEKSVGKFQIGAAFNSQDKLMGTIDVGWPNVLGRGYELELQWEFGKTTNNLVLGFTDPWFRDTPTTVGIDLYNSIWEWSGYYTERKLGGAVRLGRRLSIPDDYTSIYWRYALQQVDYYDFGSSYNPSPSYDLSTQNFPKLESSMRLTLMRDSRDSRMFATDGSKNSYAIEGAGHVLGGDIQYQTQDIRSDWYFSLHKYLTFVAKARFTFVTNWGGNITDIPYSERLFPGGVSYDGQIRGYTDRSISPKDTVWSYDSTVTPDPSGEVPLTDRTAFLTGGRAMSIYTLEFRVPVKRDQLYLSVFADLGNTWNSANNMSLTDLFKSAGGGVRFVIPMIGVIGLDMAYGFDRVGGGDWEFHFQIGPEN